MFRGLMAIMVIMSCGSVGAEIIDSGARQVSAEIPYVVVFAEVRCRAPRWEDDPFTPYFSEESYKLVASYFDQGYQMKLIDRTCGEGGSKELPADRFEKSKVLLINTREPRKVLDEQIRDLLSSFNG